MAGEDGGGEDIQVAMTKVDVNLTENAAAAAVDGGGDTESIPNVMTRKIVYPPPCTWYQTHVAEARDDMWGYCAYSSLVIVKPVTEKDLNGLPDFQLLEVNSTKFTAISFCHAPWAELPIADCVVVSGCEQGYVRLWNLSTSAVEQFHDAHKGSPVVVQWSPKHSRLIYAIDVQGRLSVWDVGKTSVRTLTFGNKLGPTCIAVSPFEDDIVAIGTKAGQVQIVDTKGLGTVLQKMRHDEEIFSVSWKPEGVWDAMPSNSNFEGPFLASSVGSIIKQATIRVWDRNGKDVTMIKPSDKDAKDRKQLKNCLPITWASLTQDVNEIDKETKLELVSCGRLGEIIGFAESGTMPDVHHSLHSNYTIFGIVQCGDVLWSLSYEPIIIGWNMKHDYVESVIPTFKGVSSIQVSPVDYTRVVFGGMDAMIRIVGMPNGYPEISTSKVPTVTSKLKGKVTAVCWHPVKENRIAFGTDEGVIGIYDWKVDNKFAMTFDKRVNGIIYTLDWGPKTYTEEFMQQQQLKEQQENQSEPQPTTEKKAEQTEDKKSEKLWLYACGGQAVYMIHPDKHSNALVSVSRIIAKTNQKEGADSAEGSQNKARNRISDSASDMKWSLDFTYLAVGYNDGRIEIYNAPYLKLRCWIRCHGRGIQFLAWRPYDFNTVAKSDAKWFASASNDGTARLFNLAELYSPEFMKNPDAEALQVISSVSTLNSHGGNRVISLAWNQLNPELIVTVSYDRTAVVWNAMTGERISRYVNHLHRLVGCIFHPSDPHKVITTSDELATDFSVHVWDYRCHPYIDDVRKIKGYGVSKPDPIKIENDGFQPEFSENHSTLSLASGGNEGSTNGALCVPTHQSKKENRDAHRKIQKAKALLPETSNALINTKFTLENEVRYLVDKTPMPSVQVEEETAESDEKSTQENVINGNLQVNGEKSETPKPANADPSIHLGVLCTPQDCARQLKLEKEGHLSRGNWSHAFQLSNLLALGSFEDIRTIIKDAIKAGEVNETLILIAGKHSASAKEELMEAYVKQLLQAEDYHKAVLYLTLLDKTEEASQVLAGKKFYREAVSHAKCLLPPELPFVTELQEKWMIQALEEGNIELACKICCSMNRFDQALSIIEKRDFPYAWKAGMYIALKANNTKKIERFGLKFLEYSLVKQSYEELLKIIEEYHESLKWMTPIIWTHQVLVEISKVEEEGERAKMMEQVEAKIIQKWPEQNVLDDKEFYLSKIKKLLLLAIPQSNAEAQMIVAKNLTLKLLDDGTIMKAFKEGSLVLCEKWIQSKNPALAKTIVDIVDKLSSV